MNFFDQKLPLPNMRLETPESRKAFSGVSHWHALLNLSLECVIAAHSLRNVSYFFAAILPETCDCSFWY